MSNTTRRTNRVRRVITKLLLAWTLAVVCSSPQLATWTTVTVGEHSQCVHRWRAAAVEEFFRQMTNVSESVSLFA